MFPAPFLGETCCPGAAGSLVWSMAGAAVQGADGEGWHGVLRPPGTLGHPPSSLFTPHKQEGSNSSVDTHC